MLRKNILFSIIVVSFQLGLIQCSLGHADLAYDLWIDSVTQSDSNIIIAGRLSIIDDDYGGGSVFPNFYVYGVEGKPLISDYFERNSKIQAKKLNGRIVHPFTFNLMEWIKSYLPKGAVNIKITSYIRKPKPGKLIVYKNRVAGEQIPFAEIRYNSNAVISVYLSIPPPLQKTPALQSVEEVKKQ